MRQPPLNIALCDDLPSERQTVRALLSAYLDENDLCAKMDEFTSGEAFLSSDTAAYLLVFLDIFMDGINGMETAKRLVSQNSQAQIVFCSTSTEFAAEAYNVDALHYLVKPITREKLWPVLNKFFDAYDSLRTVSVKVGRDEQDIYLTEVLYAEAKGKKTVLHTKSGEVEASMSLSELAALLPPADFCRPIRYAMVSLREVTAIPSAVLKLSDGTEIPISRGERERVKAAFADFRWKKLRGRMGGR